MNARSARSAAATLTLTLFAAAATFATAQPAAEPTPPPDTAVVREVQAGGAQVYACRATPAGEFHWVLVGPKAVLINDDGSDFGTHSAGPTWTAIDGSLIGADGTHPLAKIDRPGSIPALLLRVTSSTGSGVLTGVRFVRRSNTQGGLPPISGCDATRVDATTAARYSAVYTFYK